jgi:hypothetical protein
MEGWTYDLCVPGVWSRRDRVGMNKKKRKDWITAGTVAFDA